MQVAQVASALYLYTGPFLLVFWVFSALALRTGLVSRARITGETSGGGATTKIIALAIASALVCFVPIFGLSAGAFILSFIPVFSAASLVLLTILLLRLWGVRDLTAGHDWLVFLLIGAAYTLVLMLSALGMLPFDLYAAGYGQRWLFALLGAGAVASALYGSLIAWWLLLAPALWWAHLVPSGNLHDSLTDVFFLLACLVLLALRLRKPGMKLL